MNKRIWILASVLLMLTLIFSVIGCTSTSPSPTQTATPTTTASPSPTQAQVIKWNMQTAYELTETYSVLYGQKWCDWVKDITGGRLQIALHPPGTFAKAGQMLDPLSKGTFDVSIDYGGYYPQVVPISNVETGLPLAWQEAFQVIDAYYNRGLLQLVREGYAEKNVFVLAVAPNSSNWYNFGTKFPFNSLDDVKGKKIRATGIYGKYVQALGGLPTVVASGDLYMSLKTGVIDGIISGIVGLDTLKLKEVLTHYVIEPTLSPVVSAGPLINMDSWKKLPEDIKHILETNTIYYIAQAAYLFKAEAYKTLTSAQKSGITLVKLSASDEQKARSIALPLWDEVAQMSPLNAKAVEIVKQQMRDYGKLQ